MIILLFYGANKNIFVIVWDCCILSSYNWCFDSMWTRLLSKKIIRSLRHHCAMLRKNTKKIIWVKASWIKTIKCIYLVNFWLRFYMYFLGSVKKRLPALSTILRTSRITKKSEKIWQVLIPSKWWQTGIQEICEIEFEIFLI